MKKQYLHLSAYFCNSCGGPVVFGWLAVRENEISKESDIRQLGAVCLSCGQRHSRMTRPDSAVEFPPVAWKTADRDAWAELQKSQAMKVVIGQPGPVLCRPTNRQVPLMSNNSEQITALIQELLGLNQEENDVNTHFQSAEALEHRQAKRNRVRHELVLALSLPDLQES